MPSLPKPVAQPTQARHALETFKPDFPDALRHWEALWAGEVLDRPCISIVAPREGQPGAPGPTYTEGHDGDFQTPGLRAEKWISSQYWGGDAVPRYVPSFGPDMFAAFLGAELKYSPSENTSWAVPCVENWKDALPLKIVEQNITWTRGRAFVRHMAEVARGRWVLGQLDMHSNMDALSALRNPERLCLDLLDEPESIAAAMACARKLYPEISDAFRADARADVCGSTGWIPMYSPRKFNVIQCDFCCMVGQDAFRQHILPALEAETQYLDYSIYHLDGVGALRHLDDLLTLPRLSAVQWVPGAGNKPLKDWPEVLKKVIAAGKAVHIYASVEELETFHRMLGPRRVFYDVWAGSEAQARQALEWLRRNT